MKKLLVVCLVLVMIASMTLVAFADPGSFITSPSIKPGPEIIGFEPRDSECTAVLVITPFGERLELSPVLRGLLDKAYQQISTSDDLTKLNADLAAVAAAQGIEGTMLKVSELFDIHTEGCDYHEGHVDFDITLSADALSRFVGLLHMTIDGEWELISDAQVTHNGEHLQFSVEAFSPFAIVVDTTDGFNGDDNAPDTGDHSKIYLYSTLMAVSAVALVVVLVKGKKQSN